VLRPGNAAANATADLVEVAELALAQLPTLAADQRVVIRSDSAGATLGLVARMRELGVGSRSACRSMLTSARRS
jgi:hypothetical protein